VLNKHRSIKDRSSTWIFKAVVVNAECCQTSMLGSILSNILLVLGSSFAAGGWKYHEETFQVTGAQA
jgi:Ca2+/H+ antiporter